MTIRDQLERLLRIQEIADRIAAARKVVEHAPGKLEDIESRFRERNAEYVAVKERFEALEADQRKRSGDLQDLEAHKSKYMDDLMQVKNQREYAAILKEIDAVKFQIAENEEAILKDLEEIEQVKGDLAAREEHIRQERDLVERESAEVHAQSEAASRQIAELEQERGGVERELPAALIATVRRLEAGRQGLFISRAVDGVCQACYVRVRPQVFQEIKQAAGIHACASCKRLLYHEPSLRPAHPEDETRPGGEHVEAVNGSAL